MSEIKPFYLKRAKDGTYDSILARLKSLDKLALANVTLGVNFFRTKKNQARGARYDYVHETEDAPFSALLFGEVCHSVAGTVLNAAGNHYTGPDGSTVRL